VRPPPQSRPLADVVTDCSCLRPVGAWCIDSIGQNGLIGAHRQIGGGKPSCLPRPARRPPSQSGRSGRPRSCFTLEMSPRASAFLMAVLLITSPLIISGRMTSTQKPSSFPRALRAKTSPSLFSQSEIGANHHAAHLQVLLQ